MEVFNKFYSTVTNTVSQLSGVLPGNPVTREFEVCECIASAGPGLLWKVYKGYKKSTKQEASIFVFEKKALDKWHKFDRDHILETLKRGVVQLTKLKHPHILTVQHGLEESRECLAFACEPIFASLANVLGYMEHLPDSRILQLRDHKLYDIEISYGLTQIADALSFLHNDVKLLHNNISPESIVVNQQGSWKIFGFDICIFNKSSSPGKVPLWPSFEYLPNKHPYTQPQLDYLAPETMSASNTPACDVYSFGMLIYTIYSANHQPLGNVGSDFRKYKKFVDDLRNIPGNVNCVPDGLREYVKLMLNPVPVLRPELHQFLKIPYFEDVGVKTLNYLDSIFQWDNLQKSQFYKGLPRVLVKIPHRICIHRIVPCLEREFVNPPMIPFVLPNVLLIAEQSSQAEFVKYILPIIKPVMAIKHPIQILLIFMQKMELLLKLTPPEEVKSDILPMVYRALESETNQIQELCLTVLPTFAVLIDYPAMKNSVLPRIKKLCMTTNTLSVRVNCFLCLGKLLDHLDKWLVLDEVIPFLMQIPSKEPAVIMGILGIYNLVLRNTKLGIPKEVLATKVVPSLLPLCVENGLTMNQFNALMNLVKQMIVQVEVEHREKLEQLDSMKNESKTMERVFENTSNDLVPAAKPPSDVDQLFQGLGLDAFASRNNNNNGSDNSSSIMMSSVNLGDSTLSIDEKKRIVQQQEAVRLNQQRQSNKSIPSQKSTVPSNERSNERSNAPSNVSSNVPSNLPNNIQNNNSHSSKSPSTDLTNSLLETNLNQLSFSSKYNNTKLSHSQASEISVPFSQALSHMSLGNYQDNLRLQNPPPPPSTYRTNTYVTAYPASTSSSSESFFGLDDQSFRSSNNYLDKRDWSDFDTLLTNQNSTNTSNKKSNSQSFDSDMMDLLS